DPAGALLEERGPNLRTPLHGAVILGRFLGDELKKRIVEEELKLSARDGPGVPDPIKLDDQVEADTARGRPLDTSGVRVKTGDRFFAGADGVLRAYRNVTDRRTGAPIELRVALPRDIDARRKASVNYALVSTLATGALILFVLLRLLHGIVLVPL